MNKKFSITLIAAILLLNGCGSVRENRIRQDVLSDTSTPEQIRKAIDLKQLVVSMTQEQVIASWGLPCKWCYGTLKSASGDTWEYHLPGADFLVVGTDFLGIGSGTYVYFDSDQKLKHWSQK